jgi:hypothetical protein
VSTNPLVIDLARFDAPLPEVRLPPDAAGAPGRELRVQRLTAAGFRLRDQALRDEDDDALLACVRQCLPGITDDELGRLTFPMCMGIFGLAADKIDEVMAVLGNVDALSGAARTTTTAPPTKATGSRRRTRATPPPSTGMM